MNVRTRQVTGAIVIACAAFATGCGDSTDSADDGTAATTTAAGGGGSSVAAGETTFAATCSSCHGKDAKGLPKLGKDLTASTFAKGLSDADLVAFIKVGRGADDPANTTGVAMPPKGGNPALTDDDLAGVVAYLRTLEK